MTNRETAMFAAKQLVEKKASDVSVLDISARSGFADFFVIATAHSLRQLASLCDELDDRLTQEGVSVRHVEGRGDSGWILMDCGDIVINLFTAEQREHYQIEKIWGDCERIDVEDNE